MLVLNTNSGGEIVHSNQDLTYVYPDFSNILIMPTKTYNDTIISKDFTQGVSTQTVVNNYEFRGIQFSGGSVVLDDPTYRLQNSGTGRGFLINTSGATAPQGSTAPSSYFHHSAILRFLSQGELPAGKTIGKKNYGQFKRRCYRYSTGGGGSNSNNFLHLEHEIRIAVKILHSDGTITTIGEKTIQLPNVDANGTYSYMNRDKTENLGYEIETSGIIAQEGDYLFVELEPKISGYGISNNTYSFGYIGYTYYLFGQDCNLNTIFQAGTSQSFQPCPTQISIE